MPDNDQQLFYGIEIRHDYFGWIPFDPEEDKLYDTLYAANAACRGHTYPARVVRIWKMEEAK